MGWSRALGTNGLSLIEAARSPAGAPASRWPCDLPRVGTEKSRRDNRALTVSELRGLWNLMFRGLQAFRVHNSRPVRDSTPRHGRR